MYSGNYRANFLDYRCPGIYMITLRKRPEIPIFSNIIRNDGRFRSNVNAKAIAEYTLIGKSINQILDSFNDLYTEINIWQSAIMPNHIHFLLYINSKLDEHLGRYIGRFKALVKKECLDKSILPNDAHSIFEPGFNDQYLSVKRSLQDIIFYIKENPDRWFARWENPQFFRRISEIKIGDFNCRAYGNTDLLKNPFRQSVIYHRRYNRQPEAYSKDLHKWKYALYNGGIIVGGFINNFENDFLNEAINFGGRIIAVKYFPDNRHWKPGKQLFDLCSKGRLLIICPKVMDEIRSRNKGEGSREEFLLGNQVAQILELPLG